MLKAAPGIYLVKLIKDKPTVNTGIQKDKKILKGEIVDVGDNRDHDQGGKLVSTFKKGTIVYFFSYVDGADVLEDGMDKYYCVIFNDCRAYIS